MASSTSGESGNNNMWQGTAESIATANREQAEAAEARSRQYLASGELERAHRFASKAMRLDVHRSGLRSLRKAAGERTEAMLRFTNDSRFACVFHSYHHSAKNRSQPTLLFVRLKHALYDTRP